MNDPVCGMSGMEESAVATMEWKGVRYGFCSQRCYDLFTKQPEKYARKEEGRNMHNKHHDHTQGHKGCC
ncbi:MAG: YHS domain-containing protein [FCB group bacterium]|nr:YHS domain-containing protein [FCB group bacterium]